MSSRLDINRVLVLANSCICLPFEFTLDIQLPKALFLPLPSPLTVSPQVANIVLTSTSHQGNFKILSS